MARRPFCVAVPLSAAAVELGPPPGAVLSREKLSTIDDFINGEIASGNIPGAIVLIQRHGQPVYFKCFGKRDVEKATPMTADAIFPIHSVTKTITSVAAMMLVDRGKIALDDPVSKYIPSFAAMKVGVERKDESGRPVLDLVPLRRPVNIEDLLLHTSGITYGFYGEGLVKAAYDGIYLGDFDNAEFVERLAKVPLAEQPRTLWDYGHSIDVLGRVIEVASGQSLYQFEKAQSARSARHDHHEILPDRSGRAGALRPAAGQGPAYRAQFARRHAMGIRRRRDGLDVCRFRALWADAAEWRNTGRQNLSQRPRHSPR